MQPKQGHIEARTNKTYNVQNRIFNFFWYLILTKDQKKINFLPHYNILMLGWNVIRHI